MAYILGGVDVQTRNGLARRDASCSLSGVDAQTSLARSDPPAAPVRPQRLHGVAGGFDGVSDDAYDTIAAILVDEAERLEHDRPADGEPVDGAA